MRTYKGHFPFTRSVLDGWDSTEKGVYYLGTVGGTGTLSVFYIGKGCSDGGMRRRLYDHLGRWRDVTHFGYEGGDIVSVIEQHELAEIGKYKPKYNTVGV